MRLLSAIKKEAQLLVHDKVGLLLMYVMPIVLVFIITIVQDATFRLVNDNKIDLSIDNQDTGKYGDSLIHALQQSKKFDVVQTKEAEKKALIHIAIPAKFSKNIHASAQHITTTMLTDFGIGDSDIETTKSKKASTIQLYFDPVLNENFQMSIKNSLQSVVAVLENKVLIRHLYAEMGAESKDKNLQQLFSKHTTKVAIKHKLNGADEIIPNSTQHNVPAWSLFAMFFMVVSLGGNFVKERNAGSFVRLQTIPGAFIHTIISKQIVYFLVAISQLAVIFCIGGFIFPLIGLPHLKIPSNIFALIVLVLLSALAAVSYAITVGAFSKTREQANGFGAISIIIFAAIGGVMVPTFVMPEYLQEISKISPLRWCLDGFYALFLKNGNWIEIKGAVYFLIMFIFVFQGLSLFQLRKQHNL